MSSRGRFGGRPPWRGGNAPPPNWNDHHIDDGYSMPPPHFGDHSGPPPHFDQHRGPPPHFDQYEPPHFNKHQEAPRPLFDKNTRSPHFNKHQGPPRPFDKFSGPQSSHFYDDGPLPVSFEDHGRSHSSCPPWQNRPPHRGDRHPANHNRGRGRGHSNGEKGQNLFGQRGKPFGRGIRGGVNTQSARSNVTSNPDKQKLLTSKPAWLSQPGTTVGSSNPPTSKPAWLTQPVTKDSSNNSLTSKPAWLTQSVPKDSNINPNKRKPAWLTQTVGQPNNVKQSLLSVKPAWLTQGVTTTNQLLGTSQSPPPPPPPSCPPPQNQPNILPKTAAPSTLIQGVIGGTNTRKTNLKAVGEVKVAAPGEGNFISFKNSLQEYSQKKGFPVPMYFSYKRSYGFSATVHAADLVIQGVGIQKDRKEAEQQSAYEALKSLQLIPVDVPFTTGSAKPVKKRVLPTTTPQVVAKKLKGDIPLLSTSFTSPNYKSQLNEFCQRFHLPVATYDTVHEASGFVSTLVYNKKAYLSTFPQDTKKAAELNVAQFVLSKVNQAPPPDPKTSVVYKNFVAASVQLEASASYATPEVKQEAAPVVCIPVNSIQDLAAKSATPMISYKNKLQEACQKQKITLPVYETNKEGLLYSCKVNLAGKVYAASGCKTKKGSEQSAARVALQGLGCLVE